MTNVAIYYNIIKFVVLDIISDYTRHSNEWEHAGSSHKLLGYGLYMIGIDMHISDGMHKLIWLVAQLMAHQYQEQTHGTYVEWDTKECISRPLIHR